MSSSSSSATSPFPAGTTPENRNEAESAICSLGWTAPYMTGMLRQELISHFADRDGLPEPALRDYLWQPGSNSDILIESITRWRPEVASSRPAVLIKSNSQRPQPLGINNLHMGLQPRDGYDRYSVFVAGSHTLFCLDSVAGACQRLATDVYRWLIWFGSVLRQEMHLNRFAVAEMGGVSEVAESSEHYVVPVSIAYVYEEAWTIKPSAPRLKRLDFEYLHYG